MKSLPRLALILSAFATTLLIAQDTAKPHKIDQKNREFSTLTIKLKPGESIEFCNADDVMHNVFSRSPVNAFKIKTQAPGESSIVEFKEVGVTEVRCAIHPTMKLIVTVKN
jgi:plastocyanin